MSKSQDTKKLIETYYQAFNEKRFHDMLSLLSDKVVHDTNQGSRSIGKIEFQNFLKDMDTYYDERLENIVVMPNETGERAAAEFVCHGIYKTTAEGLPPARGQKYVLPVGCFFEVSDGKIARVTNYYNLNDWLKQVS